MDFISKIIGYLVASWDAFIGAFFSPDYGVYAWGWAAFTLFAFLFLGFTAAFMAFVIGFAALAYFNAKDPDSAGTGSV